MSRLSPAQFRSRFPIFERRIYVNSCSQGALSTDVEAAMHAYVESWHDNGSPWELWVEKVELLRARFAASIGADRDEIAVMPSASAGINAVASALDFNGSRSQVLVARRQCPAASGAIKRLRPTRWPTCPTALQFVMEPGATKLPRPPITGKAKGERPQIPHLA